MEFCHFKKAAVFVFAAVFLSGIISCSFLNGDDPVAKKSVQEKIIALADGDVLVLNEADTSIKNNSVLVISKAVTIKANGFDMKGADITVKCTGVTLEGLSDIESLTVGAGVGDGEFTMSDCDVNNLVVNGGGDHSIHLFGVVAGCIDVKKNDVRLHLDKSKKDNNRHSEVSKVEVNTDCKIESDDAESVVKRVFVAKEVTKVNLSGQTVVSTIVVDTETPKVAVDSEDVVIARGCVKKSGLEQIIDLVVEVIGEILRPTVPGMTQEEVEAAETDPLKFTANSKPGDIVLYNGKECKVTVNKFLSSGRAAALNTEEDTAFRAAMLKEYDNVTQYIELYQLATERKTGAQASNGSGQLDIIFYEFDRNLNVIAKIRYQWLSSNMFEYKTRAEAAAKFDALTIDQIKEVSPEAISYYSYKTKLKDRFQIITHYVTTKSSTSNITDCIVDLSKPARVSRQQDFVVVDNEGTTKSPYTIKTYFNAVDGTLNRTEKILSQMNNLGETINLTYYENNPNLFNIYFQGNGFDSNSTDVFEGKIQFSTIIQNTEEGEEAVEYPVPLRYTVSIRKDGETVFSNSFYGEESLCAKKSGNNIVVTCPTPAGSPLAKYAKVTLKKNADGIYVPDYDAFVQAYKNDFLSMWKSQFWLNKDQLIADDEAAGTFTDKLIAERDAKWETAYSEKYSGKTFFYAHGTWENSTSDWKGYQLNKIVFNADKTFTSSRMYFDLISKTVERSTDSGTVDANKVTFAGGDVIFLLPEVNSIQTGTVTRFMKQVWSDYIYATVYEYGYEKENQSGETEQIKAVRYSYSSSNEDKGDSYDDETEGRTYYKM